MESNKTQVILYMYDKLLNENGFSLSEIVIKFNISTRSFRRYIAEINCFLANTYKLKEIAYDKHLKKYYFSSF